MSYADYLEKIRKECNLRGYSKETEKTYAHCVRKFLRFVERSRLNLNKEAVKYYLLSLNASRNTSRLHYAAIRFLYREILRRPFSVEEIPNKKKPKQLPKVIPKEKIKQLIEQTENQKHKIIIMLLYSTGIRLNELINLKREDIDFETNTVKVRSGKGNKERMTIISDKIKIELLKYYSKETFKTQYILEGRKGKYTKKAVQVVLGKIGRQIGIKLTPHMLRHSFATHLLESGVDIRQIQELLGHESLRTTQIYTKISKTELRKIRNPMDEL